MCHIFAMQDHVLFHLCAPTLTLFLEDYFWGSKMASRNSLCYLVVPINKKIVFLACTANPWFSFHLNCFRSHVQPSANHCDVKFTDWLQLGIS